MRPVLRSPPFAGINPAVAAVSATDAGGHSDIEGVFARVIETRIGGTFWGDPVVRPATTVIVRPLTAADVAAAGAMPNGDGRGKLWILPVARWSRRVSKRLRAKGIDTIVGEVDPWSLIAPDRVFRLHGDDEWAVLARLAGARVSLFGPGRFAMPGDTPQQVEERLRAALIEQTRYRNPFTGQDWTIHQAVEQLADWRRIIDANRAIAVASGIAWWKRREIRRFLWAPRPLRFVNSPAAVAIARRAGGGIAIWPSRVSPQLLGRATAAQVPLVRVEDGFVRSAGLGSNLVPPLSITVDALGMHYDPRQPSELERLLQTADFPAPLLARAEALRANIIAAGIGKYGSAPAGDTPSRKHGRRLVLVAGQVEDDLSVLSGGGTVSGNLDLLRRVRADEPEAEIWFRPHPDVDAGHRRGAVADADALSHVDHVVRGGGMAALLDRVDGVHVLTSLSGFEALLRGRDVTTHGIPFYAGWGLTRDLAAPLDRRTRRLTLAQLVAGVLILYPRYLDPVTGLLGSPEMLIEAMTRGAAARPSLLSRARRLQGRLRAGVLPPTG